MIAIACVLLVSCTLSAGVYSLDDARRSTAATSWSKWAEFKTANPLDYTEIAIFSQDDDEKYALITSVVPLDTDWFGYHIFPGDIDAGVLETVLSGNSIETDPSADIGYMFRLDHNAQTVSGLSQWGSYLGAIPESFQDSPAVFECQREYAAEGDICRFNETLGEGDFMTKIQGLMLIGLREQAPEEQDLEIVNIVWGDETVRVTWKRSLTPPFDSNSLRVRYGRSPLDSSAAADELLLSYEPIHGYNYHGSGGGVSQVIKFQAANTTTPPSVNSAGELLSEWIDPATVLIGGGSIGWSPLGNSEFEGYATVTVPVGTTVRFAYFILVPIVTIASVADEAAFDACDMTNATQLGGLLDSPVNVVMNQPGVHYFVSDHVSPATGTSSCEAGAKVKVVVESVEGATSSPQSPGKMGGGPKSSNAGRWNLSPLSALLGIIAFGTPLLFGV